jgi:hypothetical protein
MKGKTSLSGCLYVLVLGLAVTFYRPLVFVDGWQWFVCPILPVRPLTYWGAFGLSGLIFLLFHPWNAHHILAIHNRVVKPDDPGKSSATSMASQLGYTAFVHLVLWWVS